MRDHPIHPGSLAARGLTFLMLGAAGLAGMALAQETGAGTPSAPAVMSQDSTVPAARPSPIVIAPAPKAATMDKFTSGNLVFLEGLFFYTRWKEDPDQYYSMSGYEPPVYEYTEKVMAAIASYSHLFSSGVSAGGSVGLLSESYSQKLVSGHEYYYSGDHTSSASLSLIGPRIGYYFTKIPGRITPFAAFEYDMISGSYNYSQSIMRIGGGLLIQVAPSAGISVGIDYVDISQQKNATNVLGLVGMNFFFK
jgi:hypothetical protein